MTPLSHSLGWDTAMLMWLLSLLVWETSAVLSWLRVVLGRRELGWLLCNPRTNNMRRTHANDGAPSAHALCKNRRLLHVWILQLRRLSQLLLLATNHLKQMPQRAESPEWQGATAWICHRHLQVAVVATNQTETTSEQWLGCWFPLGLEQFGSRKLQQNVPLNSQCSKMAPLECLTCS